MNWLDLVIIGILFLSSLISVFRGFVREVLSLASWVIALWVAYLFYSNLATLLIPYIETQTLRLLTAFFILFIVTLILGALVNYLIATLIDKTGLSGTDRVLGVAFGLLRGIAIVTFLVMVGGVTPMPQDAWWQNALLVDHFEQLALWAATYLPADVVEHINFN